MIMDNQGKRNSAPLSCPEGLAPRCGVLVISHGSSNKGWIRKVDECVREIRRPDDLPIYASFLEMVEGRTIQDGIRELEDQGVTDLIVIPLFISAGSSHIEEIQALLGVGANPASASSPELQLKSRPQSAGGSRSVSSQPGAGGEEPFAPGTASVLASMPGTDKKSGIPRPDIKRLELNARVHWTSPIGDCEPIARLLLQKLQECSLDPKQEVVLVIGHGSDLEPGYTRWKQDLDGLARRVRRLGGFAAAEGVTLLPDELKPRLDYWSKQEPKLTVLLAPLFVSPGYFTEKVIPRRASEYEYRYNGKALLPSSVISRWMEQQIAPFLG
ncbi:sirohydrochlorin chelatase [Paenibacillus senegalensis]|uniref:sirohydrochlorin chelatase n=1 Tax=Paenibacillus senegalensis TaxID=1465766 RepID=UPI0002888ABF|nr:CbiX/SirB N-terminal domain-containing protein [Paenibacillus senegalensis]